MILLFGVAVLLALGILAAEAYSLPSRNSSEPQNNLGNQGASLQSSFATTSSIFSDSKATISTTAVQTQSVTSAARSGNRLTSGWPWNCPYYSVQTVSINDAITAVRSPPSNAKIFPNNNTISFSGSQNITILALGMMPEDAANLTGMSPPSYATDDVFVVYGLIDPTLVIPSGAYVHLIFANLDDDMYHNYVVTSLAPPYYYMPMQGMMWSNSSSWFGQGGMMGGGYGGMMGGSNSIFAMMMPMLSPANYGSNLAYYYATSLTLNSFGGSYWYICTYPGHAQSGMYGKILVSG